MRSVSLQNRNSDILPHHMGRLDFYARDEDEEGAYGGLKGSPTVIFVFPQGGEQFTTRKAQLGVQRHPTTRGDGVLVQLAARVPPFLPLSKWQSSDTWPFLPVRSPNSQLARQHCAVTFPAQQMRPPNIAICLPVFRFCQLLIPTTAVFPHCTSYSCFHMSSICQCHCTSSSLSVLVLHVLLHRDPLLARPLVIEALVTVGLGKRSWFGYSTSVRPITVQRPVQL